ncbi:MAG TPA: hypothetical protein DCM08_12455 [Microscillaceae bacterium]|jgi:hypothetical protein|nr:hypothetical protein [Microscillaceae bacterium]
MQSPYHLPNSDELFSKPINNPLGDGNTEEMPKKWVVRFVETTQAYEKWLQEARLQVNHWQQPTYEEQPTPLQKIEQLESIFQRSLFNFKHLTQTIKDLLLEEQVITVHTLMNLLDKMNEE